MQMYIKFTVIIFAFLMANTMAFTIGLGLLRMNDSLFSISGILAISGVVLANCAAVQLLLAGKYSINPLFLIGVLPIIGFLLSYLLYTKTDQGIAALILYSLSIITGIILLYMTIKDSENKKSLVL